MYLLILNSRRTGRGAIHSIHVSLSRLLALEPELTGSDYNCLLKWGSDAAETIAQAYLSLHLCVSDFYLSIFCSCWWQKMLGTAGCWGSADSGEINYTINQLLLLQVNFKTTFLLCVRGLLLNSQFKWVHGHIVFLCSSISAYENVPWWE